MANPHLNVSNDRIAGFYRRWKITGAGWSLFDLVTMREELAALLGRPMDLVEEAGLRNRYRRAAILKSKHVLYAA